MNPKDNPHYDENFDIDWTVSKALSDLESIAV